MRASLKMLVYSVVVFAVALSVRRMFFWDIAPIAWQHEPPKSWTLEAAFLVLSIENTAAIVAGIALVFAAALYFKRRMKVATH